MTAPRHSWGDPLRTLHKTERECLHCGLVKVTRHESDERGFPTHWVEFWRGLEKIECQGTPVCERAEAAA